MHGARGDREGARNVYNTAIRRVLSLLPFAGASPQTSTAAPEAWHRAGTTLRAATPRRLHTGGGTTPSLPMPREARLAHVSSCRLLAMASPHRAARRQCLL